MAPRRQIVNRESRANSMGSTIEAHPRAKRAYGELCAPLAASESDMKSGATPTQTRVSIAYTSLSTVATWPGLTQPLAHWKKQLRLLPPTLLHPWPRLVRKREPTARLIQPSCTRIAIERLSILVF
jgi:hypothetical protein